MSNENKPKYPMSFFFLGLFFEMVIRKFYLFVPAVIFAIVAIFVPWAITLSLVLLAVDLVISLFIQLMIRHAMLTSDDPNFAEWRNAMLSGDWKQNVQDLTEKKMREGEFDSDAEEDENGDADGDPEDSDGEAEDGKDGEDESDEDAT